MKQLMLISVLLGSALAGSGVAQATAAQIPATNINQPEAATGQPTAPNTGTAPALQLGEQSAGRRNR